jgi:nuclease S1
VRPLLAAVVVAVLASSSATHAWGGLGHRLTGLIAAKRLTPVARQNVAWLLGNQSLADISSWADRQVDAHVQTSYWHYLNIPPTATGYDRDRDCPRQPGAAAGARNDRWRDCAVDRILYYEERLADLSLDRADRATALKFLVHFVGDLHQPFHALGVGRGGNDVIVQAFGVSDCGNDPARPPLPCNLHAIWDSRLIARRNLDESAYLAALEQQITGGQMETEARTPGTPSQWAEESFRLAKVALVASGTNIDEAYYRAQIPVVERRLAQAGLRLAAELNRLLTSPPANGGQE